MVTFILVIVSVVVAIILFIRYKVVQDDKFYRKEYEVIFKAHENIGYPPLSMEQQFRILDEEDLSAVSRLTEYSFVPKGVLKHYIKVQPSDYFFHLKSIDLPSKMNYQNLSDKLQDGFFIDRVGDNFFYIFNDRRTQVFRKRFTTLDELLWYLVRQRLKLYTGL